MWQGWLLILLSCCLISHCSLYYTTGLECYHRYRSYSTQMYTVVYCNPAQIKVLQRQNLTATIQDNQLSISEQILLLQKELDEIHIQSKYKSLSGCGKNQMTWSEEHFEFMLACSLNSRLNATRFFELNWMLHSIGHDARERLESEEIDFITCVELVEAGHDRMVAYLENHTLWKRHEIDCAIKNVIPV